MRIKSLSIIASFLVISLAVTSCLGSDNDYEPSSDNIITAFSLDTIYGITYKFTIDQIEGRIYNVDSVPLSADTIINKILIKTLTTSGYITSGPDLSEPFAQDTLINLTDSLDFMTHNPLVIRVRSRDGLHTKQYAIEVRRHKTDPDSLVWGDKAYVKGGFEDAATATESKVVLLNNEILFFTSDGTTINAYKGASANPFQKVTLSGLPANTKISSILNFKETLYGVANGKIVRSADGATWADIPSDATVVNLLTTFNETIAGIVNTGTANVFATATVNADGNLTWTKGSTVPTNFPEEHIVATKSYTTPTGGQQALLVGKPASGAEATTPWYSKDGLSWGTQEPAYTHYALPVMNEPSILYYGKTIYAFGNDFDCIYTSKNGFNWQKTTDKFMFPLNGDGISRFKGRSGYAMAVDADNYIWMFWNKDNEAWRGKLNRLGFDIQ